MVLVDGYNAIRRVERLARAEQRGGLEAGRDALVSAILASGLLRARRVVVVFDGSGNAPPSSPSPHPRLTLRFAPAPRTADDVIVELVGSARRRAALVVVSADRELEWRVRELGASVVAPERWEGFRAGAAGRPRRPAPGAHPGSDKPAPSRREVDYWLGVFGGEGESDDDGGDGDG